MESRALHGGFPRFSWDETMMIRTGRVRGTGTAWVIPPIVLRLRSTAILPVIISYKVIYNL